ncbi:FG-GAP repeat protein [candidate division KSB1 bacterium]|nr:FG-GAP repeat protein [candidate division KSB1 bacterium]
MNRIACFLSIYLINALVSPFLYSQTSSFDLNSAEADFILFGHDENKYLGETLATGDINGDGYDDIFIAATQSHIDTANYGTVYIFLGPIEPHSKIDLIEDCASITISGKYQNGLFGSDIEVEDLNSDGYDDMIIGEPRANPMDRTDAGVVHLLYGRCGFDSVINLGQDAADVTFTGARPGDHLGTAIASGDVDDDGRIDLIFGADGLDSGQNPTCGGAYIVKNTNEWDTYSDIDLKGDFSGHLIYGKEPNDLCGRAIACGDIDNDGIFDIIIGAHKADSPLPNLKVDAGEVYIFFGAANFPHVIDMSSHEPDITLIGTEKQGWFGYSLLADDIDRDGFTDLFIGAPQENYLERIDAGSIYLLSGRLLFAAPRTVLIDDFEQRIKFVGHMHSANIGWSLDTAVYENNGTVAIAIGCPQAAPFDRIYAGAGFIIYNNVGDNQLIDLNHVDHACTIYGQDKAGFLGRQISLCNLGRDSLPDLIITAPEFSGKGIVYAIFNSTLTMVINTLEDDERVKDFKLSQNYPNPFLRTIPHAKNTTDICLQLNRPSEVSIKIVNIMGQHVSTIMDRANLYPGLHNISWNGYRDDMQPATTGIYFFQFQLEQEILTRKLLLIE